MSIAHYAPGGTNSQHITIMPLAAQIPNILHYAPGGTKIYKHATPTGSIFKYPDPGGVTCLYHLFRVCTGKYSIPDNPFRWASLQKGHPDK